MKNGESLTVIGASAGGVAAIQKILNSFPIRLPTPIVVVLHLPEHSDVQFSALLQPGSGIRCQEAQDKMQIESQTIYFAPAGYHLLIEENQTFSLSQEEPVHYSRPSIDVLFESASLVFQKNLTGILLTGANEDGASGLLAIHKNGGRTVVQDPMEAAASAMPASALQLFRPDFILKLEDIRNFLASSIRKEVEWKA
ncbi:MAG: chemotaxis protein CheB [Pseudobdellovibrionaceae bacterium]